MDWKAWSPWIDRIRTDFGFAESKDRESAERLDALLKDTKPATVVEYASKLLAGADVRVLGAGNEAADELRALKRRHPLVAADGATTAARQIGEVPDVIVTDLDGPVEDQIWAARHGSFVFVHAHGDNRPAVENWLPSFPPENLAGTCQVQSFGRLINPGGFTDGDRACFLAHALGARSVHLLGFDLRGPVGRFSGAKDAQITEKKLAWCERLLRLLQEDLGLDFDPALPPVSSATHPA